MTSLADTARRPAPTGLGIFERWLSLWVALCIIVGIGLGRFVPAPFHALGRMNLAQVNMPVAVLVWLMIVPMLVKVDFGSRLCENAASLCLHATIESKSRSGPIFDA